MNITTIKKTGITTLTVKKEAQVYQGGGTHEFLANQIKNPAHICWQTSYHHGPHPNPSGWYHPPGPLHPPTQHLLCPGTHQGPLFHRPDFRHHGPGH